MALRDLAGGADRISVVDCETTGLYNSDRVVEIAVVTMDLEGRVLESWDTLVQPQRDVGPVHIHGLTAEALADAPVFADIAGDVAVRLDGACLAAHNLPFDRRMISAEFARLGAELMVVSGLDTLGVTRCRLTAACEAYEIPVHGAHSALGDATATAQLLVCIAASCVAGTPAAAPIDLPRSGKVLRRADLGPVVLPDPPYLATLVAALDHAGLEMSVLAYLELVERAVADLHLDADERRQLNTFAVELGLSEAQRAQAHRRFVNDLIDAAIADDVVTDEELDLLLRVTSALAVDTKTVEMRTRPARGATVSVTIEPGITVVFTGEDPNYERSELTGMAEDMGLIVGKGVTRRTDLLVAVEPGSNSGKAAKARSYDIPIISNAQFHAASIGDTIEGHGSSVAAKKVVTCPDCHATWTVVAASGTRSSQRCVDCA